MTTVIDRITRPLDAFILRVGQIGAWFLIPIITVVILDVVTRRFFTLGSVTLQELEWHFHAIVFLLASAWTYLNDGHVRVDIFYAKLNERQRAVVDLIGGIVFTIPFCLTMIVLGGLFVQDSFAMNEVSDAPGGLPYRFAIKSLFPLGFLLLLIQAISTTLKKYQFLKTGHAPGSAA
jgi:TRAP-type mannitol/chloroaromatic compound transport system permease small subunit